MYVELNDATISHVLGLIFPKLEGQLMLAKNVQLIEALQEIKVHEEDTSFLSPQCQIILGRCELGGDSPLLTLSLPLSASLPPLSLPLSPSLLSLPPSLFPLSPPLLPSIAVF